MLKRWMMRASLLRHWIEIHRDLDYLSSDRIENIWSEFRHIVKMYESDGRYYHTIEHILATLRFVDQYTRNNAFTRHKPLVKLALVYHDCIYKVGLQPGEPSNEDASAVRFGVYSVGMNFPSWLDEQVRELILLTKTHKLPSGAPLSHQIMNDADMSIFLAEPDVYLEYARNIWREYQSAGKDLYLVGRLKFLDNLDPNTIFHSLRSIKYSMAAMANIELEKRTLRETPEVILV